MSSFDDSFKWKRAPADIWSVREQLCLASSVLKSGDQNWISVSRSLRTISNKDVIRTSDWFSQKSCAQQYACLLENFDAPKRKKRESGETTSESIVRRLTQHRISELSQLLPIQREEYQQLKNEISLLRNGTISHEKLQKLWSAIEREETELKSSTRTQLRTFEKQSKNEDFKVREPLLQHDSQDKEIDPFMLVEEVLQIPFNDDPKNNNKQSSLLTSLLKSTNSPQQSQTQIQSTNSPTIASLLCSSPKVPASLSVQNASPKLSLLVSNALNNIQEHSSSSSPTLSKLLEQTSTNCPIDSKQDFDAGFNGSKNLSTISQVQDSAQTRSAKLSQENSEQIVNVSQTVVVDKLTYPENFESTLSPTGNITQEVAAMNKDEINEIIGDIEELIKDEVTDSPKTLNSTFPETSSTNNVLFSSSEIERSKPRNVDESASLSNSPTSEMAIEEIDSSSSNIAKIIGTAVETVEAKVENSSSAGKKDDELLFTHDQSNNYIKQEIIAISEATQKIGEINNQSKHVKLLENSATIKLKGTQQYLKKKGGAFDEVACEKKIHTMDYSSSNLLRNQKRKLYCDADSNEDCIASKKNSFIERIPKVEVVSVSESLTPPPVEENQQVEERIPKYEIDCQDVKLQTDLASASDIFVRKIDRVLSVEIDENSQEEVLKIRSTLSKNTLENRSDCEKPFFIPSDSRVNDFMIDKINISKRSNYMAVKKKISEDVLPETQLVNEIEESGFPENTTILNYAKDEPIGYNSENVSNYETKKDKGLTKNKSRLKEEIMDSTAIPEIEDEEPAMVKLLGTKAMKTYSKKQNAAIDSETETESSWENADYRAWKKSIMLVYHRLSTNKYASIFLRPITEDQAPGYHSIIFEPMDLSTIKKKIDNGTIRSTSHFQRDVMLMFQNAIMFNKHNTFVHKMTLEMQEECLQHLQVLVHATGEPSFRRETRTAANTSNETNDIGSKRKWAHASYSIHDVDGHKYKKRIRSENE